MKVLLLLLLLLRPRNKRVKKRKSKDNQNDNAATSTTNEKKSDGEKIKQWVKNQLSILLPPWSIVHNPACLTNVAILQFSLEQSSNGGGRNKNVDNNGIQTIVEKIPTLASLLSKKGLNNKSAIQLQTRLFQGNYPKSASDVLMYLDPPPPKATSPSKKVKVQNEKEVEEAMKDLRLTRKQLWKENYPFPANHDYEVQMKTQQQNEKDETVDADNDHENNNSKNDDMKQEKNDNENTTHENKRKEMHQSIIQHGETLNEFWKQKRMKIISNDDNCNNSEGKTMALPLSLLLSLSQSKDIVNALGTNVTFFTHSDQRNKAKEEESNNNKEEEEEVKYIETFQSSNSTPKLHAMDCEMVKTTKGIEVARVTLLRYKQDAATHNKEDYDVLLDTLIKPQNPILDYLTDYSGMTPQLLENVTTNLSQIQCLLLSLICKDDVIIGHSLENDLRCLRLIHGCVVDTSVIFRGRNGRKYCKFLVVDVLFIAVNYLPTECIT